MKKYKETWSDITWHGDIVNNISSKKYCRFKLGEIGEPPIAIITLPSQLAYRLLRHCEQTNYNGRYFINISKDNIINIYSSFVDVHHDFKLWKNIRNIRKLIYG